MTRESFAVWSLLAGGTVGFLGTAMLYDNRPGISFPIFVGLIIIAVIGSGLYGQRKMQWRNMWMIIPGIFFAIMIAIRANAELMFWNFLATFTLCGLSLHYMGLKTAFDRTSTFQQIGALFETGIRVVFEPIMTLLEARKWFGKQESEDNKRAIYILRGLLLTLPVLLVFGILLGSADQIFAQYLNQLQWLFKIDNIDALIGRIILMLFLSWFAVGTIWYGVARGWTTEKQPESETTNTNTDASSEDVENTQRDNTAENDDDPPKRIMIPFFRITTIESTILLTGVSLLFGAFVLVQFVYLFGGRANVNIEGFTYAEYARRGFFELVTVSVLTMLLLLITDRITVRDGHGENILFRTLSLIIIALVGVMLISAARRMALYTEVYGLTQLRLWVNVFIAWLAILFGVLVMGLFRFRRNIFSLGLVLVSIGYFGTLNIMNPDAFIAAHNIDRALQNNEALDICYLTNLSDDAIPIIAARFEEAAEDYREPLGMLLNYEFQQDNYQNDDSFFESNLGRTRADAQFSRLENFITKYPIDQDMFYSCYASSYDYYAR